MGAFVLEGTGVDGIAALDGILLRDERTLRLVAYRHAKVENVIFVLQ